jgi:bifunctional DNA-binding transcriptional regulator/antitoxin component of YhaV-PrlF toxin-antitoxin module
MTLSQSKMTSQGQVSVPREVRRILGVEPGATLEWVKMRGHVVVRRAGRFSSADLHRALFTEPVKKASLRALKAGIARHVKQRHARG